MEPRGDRATVGSDDVDELVELVRTTEMRPGVSGRRLDVECFL